MVTEDISTKNGMREYVSRNQEEMPVLLWYTWYKDTNLYMEGDVPWHWHPEVELIQIIKGRMEIFTNHENFILEPGDGVFFNSGVMHSMRALPGEEPLELMTLFDPQFISGTYNSIFEKKYVSPILECHSLEAMHLQTLHANHRKIFDLLKHACDAMEYQGVGYEFIIRNDLSSIWSLLYKEAKSYLSETPVVVSPGEERIKQMMTYVQEHCEEKITLEDIADSANISERECLRTFQQFLNTTPFTYLLEYRVRRAARQLCDTGDSITDIAYACGFSSPSYFGKVFKKIMNCSPGEYRKAHEQEKEEKSKEETEVKTEKKVGVD